MPHYYSFWQKKGDFAKLQEVQLPQKQKQEGPENGSNFFLEKLLHTNTNTTFSEISVMLILENHFIFRQI
jgi:hypothetical protein